MRLFGISLSQALLLHRVSQLQLRPRGVELFLEHVLRIQILLVEEEIEGVRADGFLRRHRAGQEVVVVVLVGVAVGGDLTVARLLPVFGRDMPAGYNRVKNRGFRRIGAANLEGVRLFDDKLTEMQLHVKLHE